MIEGDKNMDENDEPVDYDEMASKYGFEEAGPRHLGVAMRYPYKAYRASELGEVAVDETKKRYPNSRHHNDEADAFRHALWSYKVTREFGPNIARSLGYAHERQRPNSKGERLMDLHNNLVASELATMPVSRRYKDEQVIEFAIRNGYLRTKPYRIKGESELPPGRAARKPGFTATGRHYGDR